MARYKGDLGDSVYKRALGVCISLPIETVLPREALFKGCVLVRNLRVGMAPRSREARLYAAVTQPAAYRQEPRALRSTNRIADRNGMARVLAMVLFFFIVCVDAHAQNDDWDTLSKTPERLIGLLDLPDIVAGGCGSAANRATTRVFATPSQNGRSVGTIYWRQERDLGCELMIQKAEGVKEGVPTLESGYEIPAAVVFERRGRWFRIRLKEGSAWIRRTDPKDFLPFPEILRDHLAYTMQTWDGTLRATPGPSGRITPLSPGWKALTDRQLSFQYLGSRRVGNDIWLRIRLAANGPCDQTYENVTDVEGWIPAYYADRTPLAWFSSRGC